MGSPRYISSDVYLDSFDYINLGDDIVISKHVTFLTHDYSLTSALVAEGKRPSSDVQIKAPITIGDNVFIGLGTTLLPGTTIGNNVIIGARSVVKKNIPSNVVIAGNPAKVIMTMQEYYERNKKNIDNGNVFFD